MNILACVLTAALSAADLSTVSGRVLDTNAQPISGAQVFLERGLHGPLTATRTDAAGYYRFDDVLPGIAGVFAIAPGHGFSGSSVQVAIAQVVDRLDIRLRVAESISGRIVDDAGRAVAGARITRVALTKDMKFSIPFSKLKAFGVTEPRSTSDGRFRIPRLPQGEIAALKIAHPDFAQEASAGHSVGTRNISVALTEGVFVSGTVVTQGQPPKRVPNATIIVRNSEPPYDTALTRSVMDGTFSLRLKPGNYFYEAAGTNFQSPSRQGMSISAETARQFVTLYVAGKGSIAGKVMDANAGAPVEGARMILETFGRPAAVVRTGPTGEYAFDAAIGDNVVRLASAPGYLMPRDPAITVHVTQGVRAEVPSFWIAALPRYSLEVIDEAQQPVPGALVRLLRPFQFGWRSSDENGLVEISFASLPSDGTVVGLVEHPSEPQAALFAITRDRSEDAIVQLMPTIEITGRVSNESGSAMPGILVEARFTHEDVPHAIPLWQTVTDRRGTFRWAGGVPRVPQLCVATGGIKDGGADVAEFEAFIAEPGAPHDVGEVTLALAQRATSLLGKSLKWYDFPVQCGTLAAKKTLRSAPAVVIFCRPEEAQLVTGSVAAARKHFADRGIVWAVVVDGVYDCADPGLPVLRGEAPSIASTYVIDAKGAVILETMGLPPAFAVNAAAVRD